MIEQDDLYGLTRRWAVRETSYQGNTGVHTEDGLYVCNVPHEIAQRIVSDHNDLAACKADLAAALERAEASLDEARQWSALWKRSSKREYKAHIELLAALGNQHEDVNAQAFEHRQMRDALAGLIAAFTTHREATHRVKPMYCETCQESVKALERARAVLGRQTARGAGE